MPFGTLIAKKEKPIPGFKSSKNRLNFLLAGAANKMQLVSANVKPVLTYLSKSARALKNYAKSTLPVL